MSGKSSLIRAISDKSVQDYIMFQRHSEEFDHWELPSYDETIYSQIGVQLVDFPDHITHPLYFRMFDTPGDRIVNYKAGETIFPNASVILIVLDGA